MSEVQKLVPGDSIFDDDIVLRMDTETNEWSCQRIGAAGPFADVIGTHPFSPYGAYMDWHSTSFAVAEKIRADRHEELLVQYKELRASVGQMAADYATADRFRQPNPILRFFRWIIMGY